MIYFPRGMYSGYNGLTPRGLYETIPTEEVNVINYPFVKITDNLPNQFINENGDCYILYGIKAGRAHVVDELMLNFFKLFSVQKD